MKTIQKWVMVAVAFAAFNLNAQTVSAFGDSNTDATYTTSDKRWRSILAGNLGEGITSYAHGGDMVGDQLAVAVKLATPGLDDFSIASLGTNDQRIYGVSAARQSYYRDGLRSLILARALATRQTARTSGVESGNWANTPFMSIGRFSTVKGSKKTFTLTGTVLYVGILLADTERGAGTYSVKIDGNRAETFDSHAPGVTSYNKLPYTERAHRFVVPPGRHQVEIEMTGPSTFYVQWAASNKQPTRPAVFVTNIIRQSSSRASGMGYAAWGGSTANVQGYNADIATIVKELRADGFAVTLVNLYDAINDTTDLHKADGLHLSDAGHVRVASVIHSAMTDGGARPARVTYAPLTVYLGSDGKLWADPDGKRLVRTNR